MNPNHYKEISDKINGSDRKSHLAQLYDAMEERDNAKAELRNLRAWLNHQLETNIINRHTGLAGHNGNGNSWSACAIPEWDVRQKLEEIEISLGEQIADASAGSISPK